MTTQSSKILILCLCPDEVPSGASGNRTAIDDVAERGCNGFLQYADDASNSQKHILSKLLGIQDDGQLQYPTLPVAFYSSSPQVAAWVKASGLETTKSVDLDATSAVIDEIHALVSEHSTSKQLVFIHLPISSSEIHSKAPWVHQLFTQLLVKQDEVANNPCMLAVVEKVDAATSSDESVHPFKPQQSADKQSDASYASTAKDRLMLTFHQPNATRCDGVKIFNSQEVETNGTYGTMDIRAFISEIAFRLGFAPKYGA